MQKLKKGNVCLALLKLPLFAMLFLMSLFYHLFSMILPIPKLRRFFLRFASYPFFRAILLLCGCFSIPEAGAPLIETFEGGAVENEEVNPGDIIITHFTSLLDLFWLQYKYSPIFVVPNGDKKTVLTFSVFTCFSVFAKNIPFEKNVKLENIIKAGKKWLCPIVLFPEGICDRCTNHISEFLIFGKDCNFKNVNFHIVGFDHRNKKREQLNDILIEDMIHFKYILFLLGNVVTRMKVRHALPQDIPVLNNNKIDEKFLEKCRLILSTLSKIEFENKTFVSNIIKETNKIHND